MASPSSLSTSPAAAAGVCLHVLWDWDTLPCPASVALDPLVARVQRMAAQMAQAQGAGGRVTSASMLVQGGQASMSPDAVACFQRHAITIEDANNESMLARLLKLTLQSQAAAGSPQHSAPATPLQRPSVVVLSNLHTLAASLKLMRTSGVFGSIVLLHGENAARELTQSASAAVSLEEFAQGAEPADRSSPSPVARAGGDGPAPLDVRSAAPSPQCFPVSSPTDLSAPVSHLHLRTSPSLDESGPVSTSSTSLLGVHPAFSAGSLTASPRSSQPLLPTPSPAHASAAHTPTVRYLSQSTVPSPSNGAAAPGGVYGLGSARNRMTSSAPSSPTGGSGMHAHARSFFPSSMSPSHMTLLQHSQQQADSPHFRPSASPHAPPPHFSHGSHSHSSAANAARTRACVLAYHRIIHYCESEKLIPRESVLKKRLVDSRADLGAAGIQGAGGVDFDEWLRTVCASGAGVMEGEAPQRIVWPRGADGAPRKFPCCDFFSPQTRLSAAQNAELLSFLYRVQPEVERGRFGFATYLSRHGPPFIQRLSHGVLVELTQLLLNQKVLLFRKGKVSVASKSEALEAQTLGHFFVATPTHSASNSRATSPTLNAPAPSLQASPPPPEHSIWDDSHALAVPSAVIGSEASIWRPQPSAAHIDRTLLAQRRGSVGGSPLYPSFAPPPGLGFTANRLSSLSMPATRAHSPQPPSTVAAQVDSFAQQQQLQVQAQQKLYTGDFTKLRSSPPPPLPPSAQQRKSLSGAPLPLSMSPPGFFATPTVNAVIGTLFDASGVASPGDGYAKAQWLKDEALHGASARASAYPSRRASMSDVDSLSWRNHAAVGGAPVSSVPVTFEQSTGFKGEDQDACDPSAVLSARLAQLNRSAIEFLSHSPDELHRLAALVQFRASFHFEKSGAAHTPEWVAVLTCVLDGQRYTLHSQLHSKKDMAKSDVAMRALQAIEERTLAQEAAAQADQGDAEFGAHHGADPVVDLARLLNFLQQAPVVYILSPMPLQPGHSRGHSGGSSGSLSRMSSRRASTGGMGLHARPASGSASVLWSCTARLQVKSVNVLTGEAQPTVSASTPFTHTVSGATSKRAAKESIAANLLAQIERARVVNPMLFQVLAVANQPIPSQAHSGSQSSFDSASSSSLASSVASSPSLDPVWHSSGISARSVAPIHHGVPSAPVVRSVAAPPPSLASMDMSLIADPAASPSASATCTPSASFFSMHTPAPGRPFSGISSIGLLTPRPEARLDDAPVRAVASLQPLSSASSSPESPVPAPPMLRSVSEAEAESTSVLAAESALYETPRHAQR